jgi:hypothetical protein
MKIYSFLFLLAVVTLSSCARDYECTCSSGTDSYTYDMRDIKPNEADEACALAGEVWISTGGSCSATEVQ